MANTYRSVNITGGGGSDDRRVKVSSDDTTAGFLEEKIEAASSKVVVGVTLPGGDETLTIDVDETNIDHDILLNYEVDEHRPLDDATTTTTSLWSSQKIQDELDGKINAATPMTDNKLVKSIGTSGIDVEATGIDVDDSNNVTGINNLTVDGNFDVKGTLTYLDTDTLQVADANIVINKGGNQSSADAQNAGLTVEMSDATDVEIGYDSTTQSKFRMGEVGSTHEVVTTNHTQTILNKTIDADNNTISNIETDNFKTGVVQTDISGAVSDTNIATSQAIKTYVDDEIAKKDDASEITYTPANPTDWDVVPTHVDGGLDELADRVNTAEDTLSSHIGAGAGKHLASQITNIPSGNLVATDVQGALDELQTEMDGRPTKAETMQNKTFDGTNVYSGSIEAPTRSDVKQDTEASLITYAATASNGQICFATDVKKMYQVIDGALERIGGGEGSAFELDQVAHNFSVLNSVYVDDFGVWQKAQANNSTTLGTHIVVDVLSLDKVILAQSGRYESIGHGLDIGDYYYTSESAAGAITLIEPTTFSNPIVLVDSDDTYIVLPFRPSYIDNSIITQQTMDMVNNTTSSAVTNFIINPVGFRSFEGQVNVTINATQNYEESFYITGHWSGVEWEINLESIGSDSLVELDMDNAGQLRYTTPDYVGFVEAKLSFKYNLMIRGI